MRYEVRHAATGELKEATDDMEQAKLTARAMGRWNYLFNVVDTTTEKVIYEGSAYQDPK